MPLSSAVITLLSHRLTPFIFRLRQVDIKAEHFERQVTRVEQERDSWEKKFEEMQEKYADSKRELDETILAMEGL